MSFKGINWVEEIHNAVELGKSGLSLQEIGDKYGVSRQRIKQVFQQYNIDPSEIGVKIRSQRNRIQKAEAHFKKWGDKEQDLYDIKRIKYRAKKANALRRGIDFTIKFSEIIFTEVCPILGITFDYYAEGRQENSVSFDRLDPKKGYITGNVIVVSWRANRIKNDGTAEEHQKIVDYLNKCKEIP